MLTMNVLFCCISSECKSAKPYPNYTYNRHMIFTKLKLMLGESIKKYDFISSYTNDNMRCSNGQNTARYFKAPRDADL